MADTGAPWNIPYVENADLVKDYPTASLALANAIASGLDAAGNAGIGSNVVQAVKTDTFTTTSTSYTTVTGLEATITPTSATSKILIIANVNLSVSGSASGAHARLAGGNASTYVGDASGTRTRAAMSTGRVQTNWNVGLGALPGVMSYLDSPASTSPVTYSVEVVAKASAVWVNVFGASDTDAESTGRLASSLTVIEVAA